MKKPTRAAKSKKSPVEVEDDVEDVMPAAKSAAKSAMASGRESLSKRLPEMTDYQLRAYHMSTARISGDPSHPKGAAAKADLPLIEKEISRRATSPGVLPTPGRVGVAKPKSDIRKGGKDRG